MAICKVKGCERKVGEHGANGMCPYHYQKSKITIKTCPRCGETKRFYNNGKICKACQWWEKNHNGEKRMGPVRIRDGFKSAHKREYNIYRDMKNRCENPNNHRYKSYGGRGIKVCDRWQGPWGFHHFYEDMGPRPGKEYSLDRIDVNGNYEPDNCRWADSWTQSQNKQDKRMYSRHIGVTYNKSISWWVATLRIGGRTHVKYARTEEEAILLREKLEKDYL